MYKPSPKLEEILYSVSQGYAQGPDKCKILFKEIQVLRNHMKTQAKYIKSLENELHAKTPPT